MSTRKILIMAGGTGGHVYPALAVANEIRQRSHDVVWLGTHRGLEARVVPAAGIDIEWISVSGLRGKGALTLIAAPFRLLLHCFSHFAWSFDIVRPLCSAWADSSVALVALLPGCCDGPSSCTNKTQSQD